MTGNFCRLLAAFSLILLTVISLTSPASLRAQGQPVDIVGGNAPPLAPPLAPRLAPNLTPLRFGAPMLPIAPVWIPSPAAPLPSPIRPKRPVFQQLVRAAGIIFSGHVTSVGSHSVPAGAVPASTAVTFQVEHAMRGVSQGQNLTIHEWAGLWNSGERYYVGERVQGDGPQTITITDPVSGAFSVMTSVLTFGATSTDNLVLLQGVNPPTPVGTQATYPVTVRVVAADGVTPVNGATIGWSTSNGATLSACASAPTCSVISDESGTASTWITPAAIGNAVITATLAPGVYNPAKSVAPTMSATSTSSDIGVTPAYLWIAQGASASVPLTARVVNLGVPKSGVMVNFFIEQGSGTLSSASATTNSNGYASVTLTETSFSANVQVSACVGNGNSPCQTIYGNAVAPALLNLQAVAGTGQVVTDAAFQPWTVRVTDSSTPPNPVLGASLLFQSTVMRPANDFTLSGDPAGTPGQMPVILSASQTSVQSDANGLASLVPSAGSFTGTLEIEIQASAGTTAVLQNELETVSAASSGNTSPSGLWHGSVPAPSRSPFFPRHGR